MKEQEKTGIWLDFDKAYIIELTAKTEKIKRIDSNIEHFHPSGGYGSKTAYKSQDSISESTLLARKKQQQKDFFSDIAQSLKPKSELVIFGPAEAKFKLKQALETHINFRKNNIPVEAAEKLSENQMKAWVRDYF
jgi:hypothetical protein